MPEAQMSAEAGDRAVMVFHFGADQQLPCLSVHQVHPSCIAPQHCHLAHAFQVGQPLIEPAGQDESEAFVLPTMPLQVDVGTW